MAGTNLNFAYDSEVFNYDWKNTPDVVLTSIINSGAMVADGEIARLISNGSNFFTTPYYNVLGGTEQDYNGVNDFTYDELTGGTYSGVVYSRMKAWKAISFITDFNSGADPMAQIVAGVANYWIKARQTRMVKILDAVFGITGNADWSLHITDIATNGASATSANRMGATTINDAIVKACGDNASDFTLAIMHSQVANTLANLQLLEYSKYTDASGIQRALPLATVNGKTVVINDAVPVINSVSASGEKEYTTFVLGLGSLRYSSAPVDVPSEMDRNPELKGGVDMIYTRLRECIAPYGFSFKGDVTTDVAVPDAVLYASASWELKMPAKAIKLVKIVTN